MLNKKLLYENIMKDVSKIVKMHLNESLNNTNKSWKATIDYDIIAHLMYGMSIDECDPTDIKDIRKEMKKIIASLDINKLQGMNIITKPTNQIITFENVNESNILDFTWILTGILNSIGEAYISDYESCIDYEDIAETLEENNPKLFQKYEKMIKDTLFF